MKVSSLSRSARHLAVDTQGDGLALPEKRIRLISGLSFNSKSPSRASLSLSFSSFLPLVLFYSLSLSLAMPPSPSHCTRIYSIQRAPLHKTTLCTAVKTNLLPDRAMFCLFKPHTRIVATLRFSGCT